MSLLIQTFYHATLTHKLYRGPAVTMEGLIAASNERFGELLHIYDTNRNILPLQRALQALLDRRRDNIALVVMQGALAVQMRWNAERISSRIREVPEEWLKFVVAENDDIFIGCL